VREGTRALPTDREKRDPSEREPETNRGKGGAKLSRNPKKRVREDDTKGVKGRHPNGGITVPTRGAMVWDGGAKKKKAHCFLERTEAEKNAGGLGEDGSYSGL